MSEYPNFDRLQEVKDDVGKIMAIYSDTEDYMSFKVKLLSLYGVDADKAVEEQRRLCDSLLDR